MRWDRQNLFVIAGFVSTYFNVIQPRFQIFFFIAGFHCILTGGLPTRRVTLPS